MMAAEEGKERWNEADSRTFIDFSQFFVPDREEQITAFCDLVAAALEPAPLAPNNAPASDPALDPASDGTLNGAPKAASNAPPAARNSASDSSLARSAEPPLAPIIVELCCGEGLLAGALLERIAGSVLYGFDGSEAMLARAGEALSALGRRFEGRLFDLADRSWRDFSSLPGAPRAIVSSLALHHLDGAGKRDLYRDLHRALAPGGALLIADVVLPATAAGIALAARAWDEAVRQRSLALGGGLAAYEIFRRDGWNYFAAPAADPIDRPSALFDQLRWLEEAGFAAVDVYWMKAGHALFGGAKPR